MTFAPELHLPPEPEPGRECWIEEEDRTSGDKSMMTNGQIYDCSEPAVAKLIIRLAVAARHVVARDGSIIFALAN